MKDEREDLPPRTPIGEKAEIPDIRYRYRIPVALSPEVFFSGDYDPIRLAMEVTRGTCNDRRLWRKYLRNKSLEEGEFLDALFQQWRENECDGEPENIAACFQARLNPILRANKEKAKGGAQ